MEPKRNSETVTNCDACRKETPKKDIRYMSLKTCCSMQRIPLCRECYDKYTGEKLKKCE